MPENATTETGDERRRRARNEALGLEMLSRLETQGREILDAAAAVERDDGVQSFSTYRKFRERLGEFNSFCNVIETQLTRIAGERHGELQDLFRKRRAMIFRPAIAALNAFFTRLANGGAMPLGLADVLNAELIAIDDIRAVVTTPGAISETDAEIIEDIDRLEATIKSLTNRAIGFQELFGAMPERDDGAG